MDFDKRKITPRPINKAMDANFVRDVFLFFCFPTCFVVIMVLGLEATLTLNLMLAFVWAWSMPRN